MKQTKLFIAALAVAILTLTLVACGTSTTQTSTTAPESSSESTNESSTASATTTEATSEPAAVKPAILVISFGTSYADTRELTIGAIEQAIQSAYPEYEVRRAFTSEIIKEVMKTRDGIDVDNVAEAMERLVADGVQEVIIQPTYVMNGFEYDDTVAEVKKYKEKFTTLKFGKPLLSTEKDFLAVVEAISADMAQYDDGETAFVLVGHGTEHPANAVYARLQDYFADADKAHYIIGTIEAKPDYEAVLAALKETGKTKVALAPLMVVAGDHANNDILGDEEESWKTMLTGEGFEIIPVLRGLGEYEGIRNIYVSHVKKSIETPTIIGAVGGELLVPGTYENIEVSSSSSMFKIVKALVTVAEDGKMTATITLSGKGYKALFLGTAAEAESALATAQASSSVQEPLDNPPFIPFAEDSEGSYTYTFELSAFDAPINCAAYSIKKEKWYDRVIQFSTDSLPIEAFK